MHRNTPDMAVFHRVHQGLGCEIFGALAGIELSAAKIYRVCTVLNGSAQGFHRAGRC